MFLKNKILLFLLLILIGVHFEAYAAAPYNADSVVGVVTSAMAPAMSKLLIVAMTWLAAFASIQLVVTNIGLLKSGADIEAIYGKLIGSFMWIGFCIYLVNNGPAFITSVGDSFFDILGLSMPTAGSIILKTSATAGIIGVLSLTINYINGTGGLFLMYFSIFVLAVGMLFAFKIFMLHMELGLVIMLSPLSFSFLGLNALKDQGIAPFKALISLAYRIILITVILSAFTEVSTVVSDTFKNLGESDFVGSSKVMSTLTLVFSALGAYVMLAYLLFKSDSIASSLASGSTSMGTADVASAAAMGAAAGSAVATGGAAAGAAKPAQSMSNFMQGLRGGGGSVSNASFQGAGGASNASLLSSPPMASMGPSANTGGAATPLFETNKAGAPMNPDPNANVAGPANVANSNKSVSATGSSASPGVGATSSPSASAGSGSSSEVNAPASSNDQKLDSTSPSPSPSLASPDMGATSSPSASASAGSGSKAGVGGPGSSNDQMPTQQSLGKKTFSDHLSNANHHIAQEKATTVVSINTHHSD